MRDRENPRAGGGTRGDRGPAPQGPGRAEPHGGKATVAPRPRAVACPPVSGPDESTGGQATSATRTRAVAFPVPYQPLAGRAPPVISGPDLPAGGRPGRRDLAGRRPCPCASPGVRGGTACTTRR